MSETITVEITLEIIAQAEQNRETGTMPDGSRYQPCHGCVTSLAVEKAMGFPVAMGMTLWGPRNNTHKYRVPPELKDVQREFDNHHPVEPTTITFELIERE